MIEFRLPSLGADMDEGTLLAWKVAPGDRVERGQVVAVVDTSKAAVDVEIWSAGVVAQLCVGVGEKVPVGTVLATIDDGGATASRAGERAAAPAVAPAAAAAAPQGAVPQAAAPAASPAAPARFALDAGHPVSPAARRRARELDVDAVTLEGTGPHGAVTIADVERAAAARAGAAAQAAPAPSAPLGPGPAAGALPSPAPIAPTDRSREMRRAIAAAMSRSKREIPHYYLSEAIPMAAALAWLEQHNARRPLAERVLPAALMLKAVARALRRVPELNGWYRDGGFEPLAAVNAGVAIALRGGGLVAPAIHDVGAKSLDEAMRALADLVRRARAGSLRSSEMSDPTITVTNLGDQGVDAVFGVIYPPQVALVGFGRVGERAWARDGWVRAVPVVTASLAADHRVSDGHRGALFLAELNDCLQRPEELRDGDARGADTGAGSPASTPG